MKTANPITFWQFTAENTKEAIRLYFQPIRQVSAGLSDWLSNGSSNQHESVDVRRLQKEVEELRHALDNQTEALELRLRDLEWQLHPPFDSLENLALRVRRLNAWLGTTAGSAVEAEVRKTMVAIATQLDSIRSPRSESEMESSLAYIRQKLRQIEAYLGFEEPLQTRKKGASGD